MFSNPVWSLIRRAFALSVFADNGRHADRWQTPVEHRGGEPKTPLFGDTGAYRHRD